MYITYIDVALKLCKCLIQSLYISLYIFYTHIHMNIYLCVTWIDSRFRLLMLLLLTRWSWCSTCETRRPRISAESEEASAGRNEGPSALHRVRDAKDVRSRQCRCCTIYIWYEIVSYLHTEKAKIIIFLRNKIFKFSNNQNNAHNNFQPSSLNKKKVNIRLLLSESEKRI